jgi:hypothetical protein
MDTLLYTGLAFKFIGRGFTSQASLWTANVRLEVTNSYKSNVNCTFLNALLPFLNLN